MNKMNSIGAMIMMAFLLVQLQISCADALQHSEQPLDISAALGANVTFRCAISNADGRSLRVQWQTPDDTLLGFWHGPVPGFPRYTIVGDQAAGEYHLQILNVSLEDDGDFECQVLQKEKEPLRAAANLAVIVPPIRIVVRQPQVAHGDVDGSVIEINDQSTLRLICRAEYGKPAAHIRWFRNGMEISDGIENAIEPSSTNKTLTAIATLIWPTTAADNGAVFACIAEHATLVDEHRTLRTNVSLNVLYAPDRPRITGIDSADAIRAGDRVNLACVVDGGNPAPSLAWFRNNRRIESKFDYDPITAVTRSDYSFTAIDRDNGAQYECRASNNATRAAGPLVDSFVLQVQYPPSGVEIRSSRLSSSSKNKMISVRQGESVAFECHSKQSNPPSTITWMFDGRIVESSSISIRRDDIGSITVSNISIQLPAEADRHSSIVSCSASNAGFEVNQVTESINIEIYYPPGAPVIYGVDEKPSMEGHIQTLNCVSRGGNPLATLSWQLGNRKITNGTQNSVVGDAAQSVLTLPSDRNYNGQLLRCEARNEAVENALKTDVTLRVYFAPLSVHISTQPKIVIAGQMITLTCRVSSSNPPADIVWIRDGKDAANYGWGLVNELQLRPNGTDDNAEYMCKARHELWDKEVSSNETISVEYPPHFDNRTASIIDVIVVIGESYIHNLTVKSKPPVDFFEWYKNGSRFDELNDDDRGGVSVNRDVISIVNASRIDSGIYTLTALNIHGSGNISVNVHVVNVGRVRQQLLPLATIILICVLGVILILINCCLVCFLRKRHQRKKLQEKTEIVRMNQDGVRTVQMYGTTGESMYAARPESANTNRSELGNNEPISEDDQSVRTMIEVNPNGYVVNSSHTRPYDNVNYDEYDFNPQLYADDVRQNSLALQRRIASASYAPMPYPEPPRGGRIVDGAINPLLDPYRFDPNVYGQIPPAHVSSLRRTRMSPSVVDRRFGSSSLNRVNHHQPISEMEPTTPGVASSAHIVGNGGLVRTQLLDYADIVAHHEGDLV